MTTPRVLVVRGGVPCRGTVRTPGEKSISHRAVLFAALAEGTSVIHGLSDGADVAATKWGTWETTATKRSWSSGVRTRTSASRSATTLCSLSKASRSVAVVGVSTQTAPSNRSGAAPGSPTCSDPAIG